MAVAVSRAPPSSEVIHEAIAAVARELGYVTMKKEQVEVVEGLVKGNDVFGVLPTGFGKSLCYACIPGVFDRLYLKDSGSSIVLVVTPLTSIMKDQVWYTT